MYKDEFVKSWGKEGFTYEEAVLKKNAVDEAYAVNNMTSCWNPAEIIADPLKNNGYKIIITRK